MSHAKVPVADHSFARDTIDDFLDAVSRRTATPGGGSVCALAAAMGCALARMVVAYSASPGIHAGAEGVFQRADLALARIDQILRGLVDRDAQVYRSLVEARRTPDLAAAAFLDAAAVPLEIAAASTQSLATLIELRKSLNPRLLSDVGVAVSLLEAAVRGAACLVRANLSGIAPAAMRDKAAKEAAALLVRASELAQQFRGDDSAG